MGLELELLVLLGLQTVGTATFAVFELETPAWRKMLKWTVLILGTVGLYRLVGHWALGLPIAMAALGLTVHMTYCRRAGVHPLHATPRRRYYELRGWSWIE